MTLEQKIHEAMNSPTARESWLHNGCGMTFYDYVKMIITEYNKIAVNTYA